MTTSSKSTSKKTSAKSTAKISKKTATKKVTAPAKKAAAEKSVSVREAQNPETTTTTTKVHTPEIVTPSNNSSSKSASAIIFLCVATAGFFFVLWLIISIFLSFTAESYVFANYEVSKNGLAPLLAEPRFAENEDGEKISFRYIEGNPETAILVLPDTDGIKGDMLNQLFQYRTSSLTTLLIAAYPGYDISEGEPGFHNTLEAGELAYTFLVDQGVAEENITIYGQGWGGVVATHVAKEKPNAGRLILSNTPSSLQSMCFRQASIFCAFQGFYWNTAEMAGEVTVPTSMYHVRDNSVVPFAEGEALVEAFSEAAEADLEALEGGEVTHSYFDLNTVLQ